MISRLILKTGPFKYNAGAQLLYYSVHCVKYLFSRMLGFNTAMTVPSPVFHSSFTAALNRNNENVLRSCLRSLSFQMQYCLPCKNAYFLNFHKIEAFHTKIS